MVEALRPLREAGPGDDAFVRDDLPVGEEDEPLWDEVDFFGEAGVPLAPLSPPGGPSNAMQAARAPAAHAPPGRGAAAEAVAAPPRSAEEERRPQDGSKALARLESLSAQRRSRSMSWARAAELPARHVAVALFELEHRGVVERHPGGLVSRRTA